MSKKTSYIILGAIIGAIVLTVAWMFLSRISIDNHWGLFDSGQTNIGIAASLIVGVIIENVLEPSYTGKKLRLSPSVVFVSFFVWGWLLGPVGALLSMPITVMLMLILSQHESTKWLADIIGRE